MARGLVVGLVIVVVLLVAAWAALAAVRGRREAAAKEAKAEAKEQEAKDRQEEVNQHVARLSDRSEMSTEIIDGVVIQHELKTPFPIYVDAIGTAEALPLEMPTTCTGGDDLVTREAERRIAAGKGTYMAGPGYTQSWCWGPRRFWKDFADYDHRSNTMWAPREATYIPGALPVTYPGPDKLNEPLHNRYWGFYCHPSAPPHLIAAPSFKDQEVLNTKFKYAPNNNFSTSDLIRLHVLLKIKSKVSKDFACKLFAITRPEGAKVAALVTAVGEEDKPATRPMTVAKGPSGDLFVAQVIFMRGTKVYFQFKVDGVSSISEMLTVGGRGGMQWNEVVV